MPVKFRALSAVRHRIGTFKTMGWPERRTYYAGRFRRLLTPVIRLPAQLLYFPAAILMNRLGWRIAVWDRADQSRIGHLSGYPHWYVSGQLLGVVPHRKNIILAQTNSLANRSLMDHWRQFFTIIHNPVLIAVLTPLSWIPTSRVLIALKDADVTWESGKRQRGTAAVEEVHERYADMNGSSSVMTIDTELVTGGLAILRALGVPEDAWFVTLHVRERGYLEDQRHDFRDCDVLDFLPAVARIYERGGWVVRIGDATMQPLPEQPGLIDYVYSEHRSDWMDMFLLSQCRFFLGSDSGPAWVPPLFGISAAIVGAVPMGHGSYFRDDIFLPKLYQDKHTSRILSFPEILASPLRDLHTTDQVAEAGIVTLDNSPEEIVELVDEVMDRCDGQVIYTDSDEEFQLIWRRLMANNATTFTNGTRGRVGNQFARRNGSLLVEHSS
jgi:putative glycosyltransferase (TIGR04372 family)